MRRWALNIEGNSFYMHPIQEKPIFIFMKKLYRGAIYLKIIDNGELFES